MFLQLSSFCTTFKFDRDYSINIRVRKVLPTCIVSIEIGHECGNGPDANLAIQISASRFKASMIYDCFTLHLAYFPKLLSFYSFLSLASISSSMLT